MYPNESSEYREARDALLQAELELRDRIEAVAALRRELPLGGALPEDYAFSEWDGRVGEPRTVRFSELFAPGKDTLFLYSFMYSDVPCPVCTSIVDGIDGAVPHLEQHVNVALVAKAPIDRFAAHAHARGWRNVRLLSSAGTTFNADYHRETEDDEQFAVAGVFVRRDGAIRHFWSSELWCVPREDGSHARHVDFMWPMWAMFDRTPEGRPDFMPSLSYE